MALNGYQGQLRAKDQENQIFEANQELYDLIEADANVEIAYVSRIGIQYKECSHIRFAINGKQFELGDRGFYEASDIKLTSLKFLQDVDQDAIVDFLIYPKTITE